MTCARGRGADPFGRTGSDRAQVQPGDRVAIFSATRFEWAILDLAILSVGAVTVPIYETSSADQVRWVLEDSGAVVVFAETDSHTGIVAELPPDCPPAPLLRHRRIGPQGARRAGRGRRHRRSRTELTHAASTGIRASDPAT